MNAQIVATTGCLAPAENPVSLFGGLDKMNRIVLHVGPEKCGSSSIQNALGSGSEKLDEIVHAVKLVPDDVLKLNTDSPAQEDIARFRQIIKGATAAHPGKTLILSHEMMFKMTNVLVHLSNISHEYADEVIVIAYIRRQSDFLISSFGEFLFRSPERISEAAEILTDNGIDPSLFWGVERHLIAAILGGWKVGRQLSGHLYLNWSKSIPKRTAALAPTGAKVSIGVLPRAGFSMPLISDFLSRAGLDPEAGANVDRVRNPSFHPSLIEAVVNAIEAGHPMPGPHEANDFFDLINSPEVQTIGPEAPFVTLLKAHIDTVFEKRNVELAEALNLPADYFVPDERIDLPTIRAEIDREATIRAAIPERLRDRERASRAALAQMVWAAYQIQSDQENFSTRIRRFVKTRWGRG